MYINEQAPAGTRNNVEIYKPNGEVVKTTQRIIVDSDVADECYSYKLNTYLSPIKTDEIQYNANNINNLDNQYSKYNVETYCSNIEKLKMKKLLDARRDFELYQKELLKDKLRKKKLKRLYSRQLEHQIISNYEKKIEKYEDFSNRRRIKNKLMLDSYINSYENSLKLENQSNNIYNNNYY